MAIFMGMTSTGHAVNKGDLNASELKALIDSGEKVFLVNPLSDIEYNEGNIPGSVNIPLHTIMSTDKLPKDKQTLIVTYCLGPKWAVYTKAAGLVANRLYTNIATFSGGIPAWKKANYPLDTSNKLPDLEIEEITKEQLKTAIGNDCIVDIRIPAMYYRSYFTNYLSAEMDAPSSTYFKKYFHKIPLAHLSQKFEKIPKDKKVIVIDHNGKRARLAARFLKNYGYNEVAILKGGLVSFDK